MRHLLVRRLYLALCLLPFAGCAEPATQDSSPPRANSQSADLAPVECLQRGIDWLLKQQASDGGWHSTTYGQLRGGCGITALALDALAHLPEDKRQTAAVPLEKGLQFLLSNLHASGHVQAPDGSSDYPTYATALCLSALARVPSERWQAEQRAMVRYLQAAQQSESKGTKPEDADYGGWNQTGGDPTAKTLPGETNISVTLAALEALHAAHALDEPLRGAAVKYLSNCHNAVERHGDGGFYFTPLTDDPRNKAGMVNSESLSNCPRSYGTPTVDGIRALRFLGSDTAQPLASDAIEWLTKHDAVEHVPGFAAEDDEATFRSAMNFYYHAGLAKLMQEEPRIATPERRSRLTHHLITLQDPDGSWSNPNTLMREDDPLIATSFAIRALSALLEVPGVKTRD